MAYRKRFYDNNLYLWVVLQKQEMFQFGSELYVPKVGNGNILRVVCTVKMGYRYTVQITVISTKRNSSHASRIICKQNLSTVI